MRAYLEQQEWIKDIFITKACSSMVESSQKLGTLECTAKLVGKWLCSKPLTGTQLHFLLLLDNWSGLSLLCSYSCLRVFFVPWLFWVFCLPWEDGTEWIWWDSETLWTCFELFAWLFKELPCRMNCFKWGNSHSTTSLIELWMTF